MEPLTCYLTWKGTRDQYWTGRLVPSGRRQVYDGYTLQVTLSLCLIAAAVNVFDSCVDTPPLLYPWPGRGPEMSQYSWVRSDCRRITQLQVSAVSATKFDHKAEGKQYQEILFFDSSSLGNFHDSSKRTAGKSPVSLCTISSSQDKLWIVRILLIVRKLEVSVLIY